MSSLKDVVKQSIHFEGMSQDDPHDRRRPRNHTPEHPKRVPHYIGSRDYGCSRRIS